jgi:hypothetical protein
MVEEINNIRKPKEENLANLMVRSIITFNIFDGAMLASPSLYFDFLLSLLLLLFSGSSQEYLPTSPLALFFVHLYCNNFIQYTLVNIATLVKQYSIHRKRQVQFEIRKRK